VAKKRMSRKELKQIDPVTEGLSSVLDAIVGRRNQIFTLFVVFLIALLGLGYYQDKSDADIRDHRSVISKAFSTVDLSSSNSLSELETLISNNEGSTLGAVATVVRARYAANTEGAKVNETEVRAAIKQLGADCPALEVWTAHNLAQNGEGSLEVLTAKGTNPAESRILAHMKLGDRSNPGFAAATPNVESARASYKDALSVIEDSLEVPKSTREKLRTELITRLALLPGGATEDLSSSEAAPAPTGK
jgi:hypothetical protein